MDAHVNRYLDRLAEARRELNRLRSTTPPDLPGLLALCHRLRGSAGAYGFREVSRAAGRAEDALEQANGDPALLRALDEALESAVSGGTAP